MQTKENNRKQQGSVAYTEPSKNVSKELYFWIETFAKCQLKDFNNQKNAFIREEFNNMSHYILNRKNLLESNLQLQIIIVNRLKFILGQFNEDVDENHFTSIQQHIKQTCQYPPPLWTCDFSRNCSLITLINNKSDNTINILTNTKNASFEATGGSFENISVKYSTFTEQNILKVFFPIHVVSLPNSYNFSFISKSNDPNLSEWLFLRMQATNHADIQQILFQAHISSFSSKKLNQSDQLSSDNYLLKVSNVFKYENSFGEIYFVAQRENEDYSLQEVLNALEEKGLRLSEDEIITCLIHILSFIRHIHDQGYIITGFSASDVVFHQQRWKIKSLRFAQPFKPTKSSKLPQSPLFVQGFFETMSPQLQHLVNLNVSAAPFSGQANDLYNLGSLINGCGSVSQSYSENFMKIIDTLTTFQSSQRLDFTKLEQLLQSYKQNPKQGLIFTKQYPSTSSTLLRQAFLQMGSKSLALSFHNISYPKENIQSLIEKAYLFQVFQSFPDAITFYTKAEEHSLEENKPYNLIPINNNIGHILLKNSKYKQALQYFQKAISYSIKVCTKNSTEYAKSLENYSKTLFGIIVVIFLQSSNLFSLELNRWDEAEKCFQEVLLLKQKIYSNQNNSEIQISHNNLALAQEKLGKISQAIGNFKQCIANLQQNQDFSDLNLAILHEKVGSLFLQLPSKQEDSVQYLTKALKIYTNCQTDPNSIKKLTDLINKVTKKYAQK